MPLEFHNHHKKLVYKIVLTVAQINIIQILTVFQILQVVSHVIGNIVKIVLDQVKKAALHVVLLFDLNKMKMELHSRFLMEIDLWIQELTPVKQLALKKIHQLILILLILKIWSAKVVITNVLFVKDLKPILMEIKLSWEVI